MSKAYGICGIRIGYMLSANTQFTEDVKNGVHIWNVNGFAEDFLRVLPDYKVEFIESCKKVQSDRDRLYSELCSIEEMTVFKPAANYIFCRLPNTVQSAPEIMKKLFIKHNIYIKDCAGKTQPDSDRYLRIASRTQEDNCKLVAALIDVMDVTKGHVN
jgi:histidinol-phosphate/aromatic aminotransferase/cobyric acid decarboxylase-like protein